jgi:hypothetical protein
MMWLSLSSWTKRAPGIPGHDLADLVQRDHLVIARVEHDRRALHQSALCLHVNGVVGAQVPFRDVGRHGQTHAFADEMPRHRVSHRSAHQLREEDLPEGRLLLRPALERGGQQQLGFLQEMRRCGRGTEVRTGEAVDQDRGRDAMRVPRSVRDG